ncbi:MAG: SDR family oxidoreductase [Pseudobdellovibrionaceae bacterium]|uniref:SDR family NAD(P)-dependent oxidoreductase n=1 Tax=Oligoflexus sp. TaxID=1971216 RepID=UPI0027D1BE15|nr:SDR family oxidoreductase [Oligoflexus sp.]MDQ3231005.1 SDR family oxidoreductase [Pseudobdellovibrionaceae bacterium]HYX37183.1 SDR family oxidoreductase [Oligoflexus sp.]
MIHRFAHRVVIITGAASGIGLATAKRFGSEGASVVLVDRDADKIRKAEEDVKSVGARHTLAQVCDIKNPEEIQAAFASTMENFGQVNVIVNNAGLMIFKPLVEHTVEDWHDILNVDLVGAFLFIQQGFLHMKPGSAIVNVSSIHAEETTPLVASYAAAKAALISLTRSAALEGKALGIRVNAILPGAIDTPMLWENPNIKAGLETIQTGDVGQPEDVAAAIAYLASDDSKFIQGASLHVDGGRLAAL